MLTGRSTVPEKVQGLSAGADDYLTKPFQMEELSARVAALLRRPAAYTGSVLIVGAVELDTKRRRVTLSGQELVLEPKEHALLEYFMRHPGEIFSPESLLLHVWGSDSESSIDSVRTYIKKLRKKLSPGGPLIETVHTLGYRMNPS
jgi:DNA-binding response OmpR family regulator